jgi:hypothetical protein
LRLAGWLCRGLDAELPFHLSLDCPLPKNDPPIAATLGTHFGEARHVV